MTSLFHSLVDLIDQRIELALLKLRPMGKQKMIKVNIQRDARKTSSLGAETVLHIRHQRMTIGKSIDGAMIFKTGQYREREFVWVDTAGKITQQVAYP